MVSALTLPLRGPLPLPQAGEGKKDARGFFQPPPACGRGPGEGSSPKTEKAAALLQGVRRPRERLRRDPLLTLCRIAPFVALVHSSHRAVTPPRLETEAQAERSTGVSDLADLALRSSVAIETLAMANGVIKPLDIGSPPFSCGNTGIFSVNRGTRAVKKMCVTFSEPQNAVAGKPRRCWLFEAPALSARAALATPRGARDVSSRVSRDIRVRIKA